IRDAVVDQAEDATFCQADAVDHVESSDVTRQAFVMAGGDSNVPGIWGASLFMFLVVSMLNTYGLGAGIRLIMTGLIIISVIMLDGGRRAG
ncbi:hypothetical protein ACC754_38775, partial [Rhizobium johnstonii]